jgi:hypothetical protein
MYRVKLRLKNRAHIETGPRPGITPKLGSPIELSYRGRLYRGRVTNVASMMPQRPRSEALDVVHADEL